MQHGADGAFRHFTLPMSKAFTWAAWAAEATLPFLLLSPFGQRYTRRAAALLIVALHGGFALFLNLGIFVPAMLAFTPNLLMAADADRFERWLSRCRPRFGALDRPLLRRCATTEFSSLRLPKAIA